MGALASNPNAWLEVSVDGSPLLPRQRLVAVPFANVAGTIQGENLSVDPVSGIVKIKEGIQIGDSKPLTNAVSSLKLPQGNSGEIVNWKYNGTNNSTGWYTVPAGKTLYITCSSDSLYISNNGDNSSANYSNVLSYSNPPLVLPSGTNIRTSSTNYGFSGFLKNNQSWITPIYRVNNAEYTVPIGKKLVITSVVSANILKWYSDDNAWGYLGSPSGTRVIQISSGKKIKTDNSSYGWSGYLINE
jgi:hypothetical protein